MLTQTKEGHSFRKGVPFKWSKPKPVCGISVVKRKIAAVFTAAISIFGGLEGDRTLDLCDANAALSQLSYEPGFLICRGTAQEHLPPAAPGASRGGTCYYTIIFAVVKTIFFRSPKIFVDNFRAI